MVTDSPRPAGDAFPQSLIERAVAELWGEVLRTSELPTPTDSFFSLGGDSMAMVLLEFRIKEEFSVELPVGAVLRAPTLRELSLLVEAARGDCRTPAMPPALSTPA